MKTCPHCNGNLGRPFICDICGQEVEKNHRKLRCWECSLLVNQEHKAIYKTVRARAIESAREIVRQRQKALRTTTGGTAPDLQSVAQTATQKE